MQRISSARDFTLTCTSAIIMREQLAAAEWGFMEREELNALIARGPVRVRMNNGETYDIPNSEMAAVGDISADVLVRGDDGRLRHRFLSLVCICSVEVLNETSDS